MSQVTTATTTTTGTVTVGDAVAPKAQGHWYGQAEAVVGLAHRAKNLPCQDAALAGCSPDRAWLVVADGAGSSPVSDWGAQAVVTGMARLLQTLGRTLGDVLDVPEAPPAARVKAWALLLTSHARGLLTDLADAHRRPVRDVRCTLLLAVLGKEQALWLKVGDGVLLLQETAAPEKADMSPNSAPPLRHFRTLGQMGKGEYANETTFLDSATPDDVQFGLEPLAQTSGWAAMSDGAAEKLVSLDGKQVAPHLGTLMEQLRQDKLPRQQLTRLFYEPAFCEKSTGDDRSLAMLARPLARVFVAPPQALPQPEVTPAVAPVVVPVVVPVVSAVPAAQNTLRLPEKQADKAPSAKKPKRSKRK